MFTDNKISLILICLFIQGIYGNTSKVNPSGERKNYGFLMFENFPLNEENFKEELSILKLLKDYKENLKMWNDFFKEQYSTFVNRKNDTQLIYNAKLLLHRLFSYKTGKILSFTNFTFFSFFIFHSIFFQEWLKSNKNSFQLEKN